MIVLFFYFVFEKHDIVLDWGEISPVHSMHQNNAPHETCADMQGVGLPRLKKHLPGLGRILPSPKHVFFQLQKNHQKYNRPQTTAGSRGEGGIPEGKTSAPAFRSRLLMIVF